MIYCENIVKIIVDIALLYTIILIVKKKMIGNKKNLFILIYGFC